MKKAKDHTRAMGVEEQRTAEVDVEVGKGQAEAKAGHRRADRRRIHYTS